MYIDSEACSGPNPDLTGFIRPGKKDRIRISIPTRFRGMPDPAPFLIQAFTNPDPDSTNITLKIDNQTEPLFFRFELAAKRTTICDSF